MAGARVSVSSHGVLRDGRRQAACARRQLWTRRRPRTIAASSGVTDYQPANTGWWPPSVLASVTRPSFVRPPRQRSTGRRGRCSSPAPPKPEAGRAVEFVPVFYPGVPTQAAAASITVKAGEERRGVDVLLNMVPTAKITGTVGVERGPLPQSLQVAVIAHDTIPGIPFSGFGTARVDAAGSSSAPVCRQVTTRSRFARIRAEARGRVPAAALFGIAVVNRQWRRHRHDGDDGLWRVGFRNHCI